MREASIGWDTSYKGLHSGEGKTEKGRMVTFIEHLLRGVHILVHLPHLSAPVRGGTAKAPILQTGQIKNLLKVMQLLSAFDLRLV